MPKSKAAHILIESRLINEDTREECYCIFIGHILDIIEGSELIDQINKSCSTNIGFFGQDKLSHEELPPMVCAIEKANPKIRGPIINTFCDELKNLCMIGVERKLPLYFVL